MIYFSLNISNPFCKREWNIDDWFRKDFQLTEHKYLGIQIGKPDWDRILLLGFEWRDHRMDHKGFSFDVGTILGYILIDFYDNRHSEYYN